jgi:S-formylglutathione hydrolase FrmB
VRRFRGEPTLVGRLAKLWSLAVVAFLATGSIGAYAYVIGAWRYRGYPPPVVPATVQVPGEPGLSVPVVAGALRVLDVTSPALGDRTMRVPVLLPPGYRTDPTRRYPVLYLLHGTPGQPTGFLTVGQVGVWQAELQALGRVRPMIIVMPPGGLSTFDDTEWADGVATGSGWATYVARDVVRAVDDRLRAIPAGWARAIGGLSEGGYGAINIALHHPGEFDTVESWSGYEIAQNIRAVFAGDGALMAANSPIDELPRVASRLSERRVRFWFYTSTRDPSRFQNLAFARMLASFGIANHAFIVDGGHDWATWRPRVPAALIAASAGLVRRPQRPVPGRPPARHAKEVRRAR